MECDLGKPQGRQVGGVDTDVVSEPNRSAWFHAFQRIEGGIEGACRGVQIDLQLHPGAFRTALDVAVADLVRGIQAGTSPWWPREVAGSLPVWQCGFRVGERSDTDLEVVWLRSCRPTYLHFKEVARSMATGWVCWAQAHSASGGSSVFRSADRAEPQNCLPWPLP